MATTRTLTRMFRIGVSLVPDPAPDRSPEQAFAMLAIAWPAVAHCTLDTPVVEGDTLVYPAIKPPAQTKGAAGGRRASTRAAKGREDAETQSALAALDAWADADSTATFNPTLHGVVGSTLIRLHNARPSLADPFRIPMP
ncbi:PRTRC system protein C [Rhodanobacter sp. FW106-PBR-R2A-1-13]|uniref:PRTRC system protein C n=1 Tax=Rhodanobacter sp. FW106-PBR-R2A-1-13 TaxID=3454845 RepID=UPI0034E5C74A